MISTVVRERSLNEANINTTENEKAERESA